MRYLRSLGCDVVVMDMPMIGRNWDPGLPASYMRMDRLLANSLAAVSAQRRTFLRGQKRAAKWRMLRAFVEPVVGVVSWAKRQHYDKVYFAGHSGGAWTASLMMALDDRIERAVPWLGRSGVVGRCPWFCLLRNTAGTPVQPWSR